MIDPKCVSRWLDLARGLLEQPTAACKEECPQAFIRSFTKARKALRLSQDAAGNLLVKYPARGSSKKPPLVLVAHLDHPGFWIDSVSGDSVQLSFKGGVGAGYAQAGQRVEFFETGNSKPAGTGELTEVREEEKRLAGAVARITSGTAPAGGFAMWAFPGFSVENDFIVARCCDDLLGAAAALCVLDEISRRKPKGVAVWGLFTRAEEVGFLGALEAIRLKTIPKKSCVLSLECSKAAGIAPQGEGAIVRVGDRASIFDPNLTEALRQAAETVSKEQPAFKYQRRLMDGGSCEATAFCAYGYRSSGVAVPLGNYHNQSLDGERKGIGAETVKLDDFLNEAHLLLELAQRPELLEKKAGTRKPDWLLERARAAKKELCPQAAEIGARKKWVD
ncbi:MAG TPA: hypothetical protein VEK08_16405 [Planctomycetota bacterium]|nr:hypothetical protein [Planctomycetota bacterium]